MLEFVKRVDLTLSVLTTTTKYNKGTRETLEGVLYSCDLNLVMASWLFAGPNSSVVHNCEVLAISIIPKKKNF